MKRFWFRHWFSKTHFFRILAPSFTNALLLLSFWRSISFFLFFLYFGFCFLRQKERLLSFSARVQQSTTLSGYWQCETMVFCVCAHACARVRARARVCVCVRARACVCVCVCCLCFAYSFPVIERLALDGEQMCGLVILWFSFIDLQLFSCTKTIFIFILICAQCAHGMKVGSSWYGRNWKWRYWDLHRWAFRRHWTCENVSICSKLCTVIAQNFVHDLILYISYFWQKVRNLVAYKNHTHIQVYLTPPSLYENF